MPVGDQPNLFGASRKHILAACEASLRRLQTDYLDLYYLHGPDPVTPLEETFRAYDDLVRQGKVRYVGVSNLFGWQVATGTGVTLRLGLAPLVAGQYIYSPIHRELEQEVIPAAVAGGIGLTCYGVFGAGLLAGKYKGMADPPKGTRMQLRMQMDGARFWHPKGHRAAQAIQAVSERTGVSMAKLAIAWPLGRKFVSAVVLGISTRAQMLEDLEAADWDMPREDWNAIEAATRPAEDNLTWFNRQNYQRVLAAAEFHDERVDLL
jgi:aryl-alcohol dehydrogenase-like predicted oxidoreductase